MYIYTFSEDMFPESTQATQWMFPSAEVDCAPVIKSNSLTWQFNRFKT